MGAYRFGKLGCLNMVQSKMLELIGEKVILREFTEKNLLDAKYYSWLRNLDVVTHLYRLEYLKPINFSRVENYVRNLLESDNDCFFAIYHKTSGAFIGTQRVGHINWRSGLADIGIMIGDQAFWGKGLGSDALKVAIRYAFTTLSLRKVVGGTPQNNISMCRCFEKIGFVKEAVKRKELLINGEYIDHIHYGLLKEEAYL